MFFGLFRKKKKLREVERKQKIDLIQLPEEGDTLFL